MTGLAWRLKRLRAMGPREVAYRGRRCLAQGREGRRVREGWAPEPPVVVGPALSLFEPVSDWREEWTDHYQINEGGLDLLTRGYIGFFGHAPLDVGTPVQWHRCPLTGVEAPREYGKAIDYRDAERVGNAKFLWELGRHQHLVPLAVGYAVTGQRRYRDAVLAQIEGWIAANPFGLGIHWCSALEVALRLISWALIHGLLALRDDPHGLFAAVRDPRALGRSLYRQAAFVRGFTSRYSSANNHLIGELTGLLVACRASTSASRAAPGLISPMQNWSWKRSAKSMTMAWTGSRLSTITSGCWNTCCWRGSSSSERAAVSPMRSPVGSMRWLVSWRM